MSSSGTARSPQPDLLRLIASFLVVLVHTSAQYVDQFATRSRGENTFVLGANILAFSGVSLFFMLSGALALSPSHEMSVRYALRRFLRLVLLFFFWKAFYLALSAAAGGAASGSSLKEAFLLPLLQRPGHYHLWFLPASAVVTLFFPLIKGACESKPALRLYLSVFFFTAILLPTLFLFEFPYKYLLMDFMHLFDFTLFGGYLGYVLLGRYLTLCLPRFSSPAAKLALAASGISALAASVLAARSFSDARGESVLSFSTPFSLGSLIVSCAVFALIMSLPAPRRAALYTGLARCTLGIYLLHPLFLDLLMQLSFLRKLSPFAAIPLLTLLLFALCASLSLLLLKIPGIRRLIL